MSRSGSTTAVGTRLFAAYAAASLVPVVVLGGVLAAGNRQDAVDRALEYGSAQAAVVEEMAIAPALRGQDLAMGLTGAERERLQVATDLAVFRGSILRLRLRDFSGAVVFADDGSGGPVEALPDYPPGEGVVPATGPAFTAAADGGTDVALLDDDGLAVGRVIRVLQPIVADTSGRSVGVLELLLPYDAVAAEVEAATARTYWRLGAGLGVLYLVLGAISWSTTRRLRRQAAQAAHDALHDPLTGLANRELFARRVTAELDRGTPGAVVLVDLDRFKEVNDTLGHHAGDHLLREVGRRLAATVRSGDTVARLGGDEFGLLLPGVDGAADAREARAAGQRRAVGRDRRRRRPADRGGQLRHRDAPGRRRRHRDAHDLRRRGDVPGQARRDRRRRLRPPLDRPLAALPGAAARRPPRLGGR